MVEIIQAGMLALLHQGAHGLEVLLTKRAPNMRAYPGCYVFPGGRKEATESNLKAAAIRETWEEIGYKVEDTTQVFPLWTTLAKRQDRPDARYFIELYVARMPKKYEKCHLNPNNEVVDILWLLPEVALNMYYNNTMLISPATRSGLELLRSYKTVDSVIKESRGY